MFFPCKSQPGGFDSPKSILWLLHNLQFIISRLVDVAPHSPWFLCTNQGQRRKINPSVLFWCVKKWRLRFVVWCSRCSTTQTPKLMVLYNLDFWLPKKTRAGPNKNNRGTPRKSRERGRDIEFIPVSLIHMYLDEWIFSYFTTLKYGVFEGTVVAQDSPFQIIYRQFSAPSGRPGTIVGWFIGSPCNGHSQGCIIGLPTITRPPGAHRMDESGVYPLKT